MQAAMRQSRHLTSMWSSGRRRICIHTRRRTVHSQTSYSDEVAELMLPVRLCEERCGNTSSQAHQHALQESLSALIADSANAPRRVLKG